MIARINELKNFLNKIPFVQSIKEFLDYFSVHYEFSITECHDIVTQRFKIIVRRYGQNVYGISKGMSCPAVRRRR